MTCADAPAGIAVEVLVKQNEIVPVAVGLKFRNVAVDRPLASFIAEEDLRKSARELGGHFPQREHVSGARRELNFEIVAEVVKKLLQRLDEQEVYGKPDRSATVGIPAEQAGA